MTYVTCRLTAKNRDQLRNPTLGNRVWATFTFLLCSEYVEQGLCNSTVSICLPVCPIRPLQQCVGLAAVGLVIAGTTAALGHGTQQQTQVVPHLRLTYEAEHGLIYLRCGLPSTVLVASRAAR